MLLAKAEDDPLCFSLCFQKNAVQGRAFITHNLLETGRCLASKMKKGGKAAGAVEQVSFVSVDNVRAKPTKDTKEELKQHPCYATSEFARPSWQKDKKLWNDVLENKSKTPSLKARFWNKKLRQVASNYILGKWVSSPMTKEKVVGAKGEQERVKPEYVHALPSGADGNALGSWGLLNGEAFGDLVHDKKEERKKFRLPFLSTFNEDLTEGTKTEGERISTAALFLRYFFNVQLMLADTDRSWGFSYGRFGSKSDLLKHKPMVISFTFVNDKTSDQEGAHVHNYITDLFFGGGGQYIEEHAFPHFYVPETTQSTGKILIGRRVLVESMFKTTKKQKPLWREDLLRMGWEELKKRGHIPDFDVPDAMGRKAMKEDDGTTIPPNERKRHPKLGQALYQFIAIDVPYGHGLFAPPGSLHADSATQGTLLTPISLGNGIPAPENADSVLIRATDPSTEDEVEITWTPLSEVRKCNVSVVLGN